MKETELTKTLRSSFLAGVCIGIAGFGYLAEKSIIGAVLFAFGLLTVVHYGLKLYTGTAGFIQKGEVGKLFIILGMNIIGCLAVAMMVRCSPMPLQETAQKILEGRLAMGALRGGVLAIGCGFIMTTAVTFARKSQNLPLLFGVPLFIMCGFPHCVADAFYYLCVPVDFLSANLVDELIFYVSIVAGNFVGCNLYRIVFGDFMKKSLLCVFLVLAPDVNAQEPFWLGADMGWLTEQESRGVKFYDKNGNERECMSLMADYGINAERVRVWVDPSAHGNWCNKEDVLKKCLRAKSLGQEVMVNFHYSDWWADPAKQNIPASWKGHSYEQMKKDLANHTVEVLSYLKQNGVTPKWVQVGNETSHGMLWSVKVDPKTGWEWKDENGNTQIVESMGHLQRNPEQYAGFFKAGYDAVKSVFPEAIVIVHLDNGFDNDLYNRNLDTLVKNGAKFDMIGMSLYPYWSIQAGKEPDADKTITDCIRNINLLTKKYGVDVMITETGYEVDEKNPKVMEEGRDQLRRLIYECKTRTDGHCKGVFYWEPQCSPRQYKLGAFTSDGRPTVIMDGFLDKHVNGQLWFDNNGKHINAHGGNIISYDGKYYWYGENRPYTGFTTEVGVEVYSSTDLVNWTDEGVALAVSEENGHDIERGCIMERPKVVYNEKTKKFVMLFHLELKGRGYEAARVAFAESDSPVGPFRFIRSLRTNANIWPFDMSKKQIKAAKKTDAKAWKDWWTPEWRVETEKGMYLWRDMAGGQMSRDMTVFIDDDGKAYHITSSQENLTLLVNELTDDYLDFTGKYNMIAPGGQNEAPCIMKHDGKYWLICSGCTGWDPNEARMFVSENIWGPWTKLPSPFVGEATGYRNMPAKKTFGAQGTYIMNVNGNPIFMADIWNPRHLSNSLHLWLPIDFNDEGTPVIKWTDEPINW